ncbi:MAG: acetyl-CoA carboxylase biotin carboxyl carrier protein [Aestuariivirga sp.]
MAGKKSAPTRKSDPELDLIRSLANILGETGLSEIELDRKGTRFRVSRAMTATTVHVPASPIHHAAPVTTVTVAAATAPAGDHPGAVKSPMVGTIYLSSAPGTPPFIQVGSEVKQGQTLLIIEAMKTMNQIPSPASGKITQILVENGQPVEFGEALVVIE